MTGRRTFTIGLIAAFSALTPFCVPPPAASSISVLSQISNIAVTVDVGTPTTHSNLLSAGAGASETVNLTVGAASEEYIQPSAASLTFAGNAGQTVTQSCAESIRVSPKQEDSSLAIGLDTALTSAGGTAAIPAGDVQYQVATNAGTTAWTSAVDYATDGNAFAALISLKPNEAPICLNIRVRIPSGATPGLDYATLSLAYFTAGGVPAAL